jgi:hypothetical protein
VGYKQRTTIKLLGERPKTKYVVTPKSLLLDNGLTADARLVGIYLLSLSDGWEINQQQIAQALGMPTKSKRVGNAMRNLIDRGWLRHNEHKSGNRTFKHEYVMSRSHRFNTVESTPYETSDEAGHQLSYTVDSTPLYTVESTPSPKYQINTDGSPRPSSEVGRGGSSSRSPAGTGPSDEFMGGEPWLAGWPEFGPVDTEGYIASVLTDRQDYICDVPESDSWWAVDAPPYVETLLDG